MPGSQWIDIGSVEELKQRSLQKLHHGKTALAVSYKDGRPSR